MPAWVQLNKLAKHIQNNIHSEFAHNMRSCFLFVWALVVGGDCHVLILKCRLNPLYSGKRGLDCGLSRLSHEKVGSWCQQWCNKQSFPPKHVNVVRPARSIKSIKNGLKTRLFIKKSRWNVVAGLNLCPDFFSTRLFRRFVDILTPNPRRHHGNT